MTTAGCQPQPAPPSAAADPARHPQERATTRHYPPPETGHDRLGSTTSLGTHELNAQWQLTHLSPYERYRHDYWQQERQETARTLDRIGTGPKVVRRFCSCGSNATVLRHKHLPDLYKVGCFKCRHRLCYPCQREKGCIIEHNLAHVAASAARNLSLLTLTLKHTAKDLRSTLTRLINSFRELRRTLLWKRNVKAGAWTVEIKIGKDGRWHPHIHALLHNTYMEQGFLTAAWLTVTGDSSNVHIKRINPGRGARYIAKYVIKPYDPTIAPGTPHFEEFAIATRGMRRCATLGTWRGTPLAENEQDEELIGTKFDTKPENWFTVDTLDNLLTRIKDGDAAARAIFSKLGLRPKRKPP